MQRIPRTPSRVPLNCHCNAKEESAEGPDDSSQGALPSATSRSSLLAPQNLGGGRKTPRRSQEREPLQRRPRRQLAEADSRRSATYWSSRTTELGRQGRKDRGQWGTQTGSRASCWPRSASRSCTPVPVKASAIL